VALVPGDPTRIFISTDADPATGAPLLSAADGQRHWEVFRGVTADGRTWRWQPLTRNSTQDNLRPIVPRTGRGDELVLWVRGRYRSYTDYDLEVVGLLRPYL
jgi:hypothetical protein